MLGEALLPPLAGRVAGRGDVRFHRAGVARRRRHLLPRPEEIWGEGRDELLPATGPDDSPNPPPSRTHGGTRRPPSAVGAARAPPRGCSGAAPGSPRATGLLPARPSPQPPGRQPAVLLAPPPPPVAAGLSGSGGARPALRPPGPGPPRALTRRSGLVAGSASAAKGVWQRRKLCNYGRGWIAV